MKEPEFTLLNHLTRLVHLSRSGLSQMEADARNRHGDYPALARAAKAELPAARETVALIERLAEIEDRSGKAICERASVDFYGGGVSPCGILPELPMNIYPNPELGAQGPFEAAEAIGIGLAFINAARWSELATESEGEE